MNKKFTKTTQQAPQAEITSEQLEQITGGAAAKTDKVEVGDVAGLARVPLTINSAL